MILKIGRFKQGKPNIRSGRRKKLLKISGKIIAGTTFINRASIRKHLVKTEFCCRRSLI